MDSPAIWVGSYGKYNKGNLAGKWFKLDEYADRSEFIDAALAFHADEHDPELMFNDWECIPAGMVSEYGVDEKVWDFINHPGDFEAKSLFAEYEGEWDGDRFDDAYCGEFESEIDYAWEFVESAGYLSEMPDHLRGYFDIEKFARDLFMDHYFFKGHVYRMH